MNSCVRWGTSGPTGSRRTPSTKRALPTIGAWARYGWRNESSTVSEECWRCSSGRALSLSSKRCTHSRWDPTRSTR